MLELLLTLTSISLLDSMSTIPIALYLLGPLFIADGIGWFIGYPILDFTA